MQIVHSDLGKMEVCDPSVRDAQRKKLTQANFSMGKSPNFYATTKNLAFVPMRSEAYSQDQRKKACDANRRTNFISQSDGGFEPLQKKFDFGVVPDKGQIDNSQVKSMIDNLRKEHFKFGEQNSVSYHQSNQSYGQAANSAKKPERVPWATRQTNYKLGTDEVPMSTDNQDRFSRTGNFCRGSSMDQGLGAKREEIKAKMNSDSVQIAGNNNFNGAVTSRIQF